VISHHATDTDCQQYTDLIIPTLAELLIIEFIGLFLFILLHLEVGTLFRTLSNAAHTVYLLLDVIRNIFTYLFSSTSSAFTVPARSRLLQ